MEGILTGGDRGRGGGGGGRGRGAAGCPLLFGLSRAAPTPFLAALVAVLPASWAAELLAAAARSSDGSSSCAIVAVEAVPAEFLVVPSSWSAAVPSSPAPSCSTAAAALALPSAASSCTSGAPVADDGAASGSAVPLMSSVSSVSPSPRLATYERPEGTSTVVGK